MKHLLLCCNAQDMATVIPLARRFGAGVEMQEFYTPAALEDPHGLLAHHLALLEDFTGARAVHGPFGDLCPGSFDPLVREVARTRIRQVFPIAERLGAGHLILHHGYVPNTSSPDNWLNRSTAFWQEILAELPVGVTIHLENHQEATPEQVLRLIGRVADPRLGICLDIGHAHAISRVPVVAWITALGRNLTYVHLHDNDGSGDQHLPLGQGNIPLVDVFAALEEHAPKAIWMIEAEATASLAWLGKHHVLPETV